MTFTRGSTLGEWILAKARLTEEREVEVVGGDAERQGVEPGVAARTIVPTIPG